MKYIGQLLFACGASVALYFVTFGFVVSRPLVIDLHGDMLNRKLAYAAATGHPKMFVIAGSNGRFSHSCVEFEKDLGHPCVNLGLSADVGVDWITDRARPYITRGDLVYIPLEYVDYGKSRASAYTGSDAAYRFRYEKLGLVSRGAEGIVRAAFMFDIGTFVQSIGEMGLHAIGIHRRSDVALINKQGDEIEHGDKQAVQYEDAIRHWRNDLPLTTEGLMDHPDGGQRVLGDFLDWCKANGVIAVGGLPTMFNDTRIPAAVIDEVRAFYQRHGARFVALPNQSQYPRSDFFDTDAHLRERQQAEHSRRLADLLRPLWQVAAAPSVLQHR